MNCQEFDELSGAYALGALPPEERQLAEEHLADCPACRKLAQELQAVTHLLPLSVRPVEHSPLQKEVLFARIRASEAAHHILPSSDSASSRPRSTNFLATWSARTLASFAALLLISLGVMAAWNISLQHQITTPSSITFTVYALSGSEERSEICGELITMPQQDETMLVMHRLPHLQGTNLYQGWFLRDNKPSSIGVLSIRQDVATLRIKGDIRGYDAVAISLEPGPQASPHTPQGRVIALGLLKRGCAFRSSILYMSALIDIAAHRERERMMRGGLHAIL
ncbi:hypothetical protein KSX_48410 [Ktedonospora formicarum]|uniref:Regulator of SigK n=2 Tax=Ktedonospora formicarum TaxID=2778364 RepID=A0A8J3MUJ2_9CHLR|nr:hypothetical protein KSX_48410 [Ktedonospora formicarum]